MYKLFLFSALVILHSCSILGIDPDLEKISFKPTQCANPWDNLVLSSKSKMPSEKFNQYLLNNGISKVKNFSIKTDNGIYCEACNCVGNDTYVFSINKNELSILKNIPPFDSLLE